MTHLLVQSNLAESVSGSNCYLRVIVGLGGRVLVVGYRVQWGSSQACLQEFCLMACTGAAVDGGMREWVVPLGLKPTRWGYWLGEL